MQVTEDFQKMFEENDRIFKSWFGSWLISHVLKFMDKPKWFCGDRNVKTCDFVLFNKNGGSLAKTCQYGMIHEAEPS